MVKKFYKGKDKYVVRETAKDYTDVEAVWLTDSKDKKCLGGALWTKLITGFVRLDKWMMRALKKRSGRLNTDEPMKTEEAQERRMVQFSQSGLYHQHLVPSGWTKKVRDE